MVGAGSRPAPPASVYAAVRLNPYGYAYGAGYKSELIGKAGHVLFRGEEQAPQSSMKKRMHNRNVAGPPSITPH